MVDRIGQQLGNYRLIRLLGQGGFAEVYLGEHVRLNSYAAVKVLNSQLAGNDAESFQREAHTIARLLHPHIIRVFDYDIAEDTPFLTMDYAPNGTLRHPHPKGTRVPLANIVSYVRQVADALQYAHSEKIIHRDIKPENMLLGRNNEVLLSDFGIAMMTQSSRYQNTLDIVGTVAYMSPEQIQGKPLPASDQYSLGIVVYEWLSGERPFHGSFTEIAVQHVVAPVQPLHENVPGIPQQIEEVVMIALAKDPRQRFASVQSFANAFQQASQSVPSLLPPSPVPYVAPLPVNGLPSPVIDAVAETAPTIPAMSGSATPASTPVQQPLFTPNPSNPMTPNPVSYPAPIIPSSGNAPAQRARVVSRRAVLAGLAGLVVIGGGVTGLALTHHLGPAPQPPVTRTPVAPTTVPTAQVSVSPTTQPTVSPTQPPLSSVWSPLPALPSPEADNVAIYVSLSQGNYVYMTGGYRGINQSPRNDDHLYRYNVATSQWETVTSNFPGMFNNAVARTAQNTLFFTGGYSSDNLTVTPLLYQYQLDTGATQQIVPPSTIVFGYGGAMVADQNGNLYITQGFMQPLSKTVDYLAGTGWYQYNTAQGSWKTLQSLPVGVGYNVLALDSQGDILMMGGVTETQQNNGTTAIYRYQILSDSWTQEQANAPQAFNGVSSCNLGNGKVVVIGGYDPAQQQTLSNTWLIDLRTLQSTALMPLPGGSRLGAATYDGHGNVYLVRGVQIGADAPTQDFWRLSLTF